MCKIIVTEKVVGKIKPMHAVNNGPVDGGVRGAFETVSAFMEAEIPYVRNHDASFSPAYGGEHTVDVHRIFKNFDADENDPASYVFEPTDAYLQRIERVGSKTFYRLGAAIEHRYKYGTYPPKDYLKWARICEHIILHYTEGWANGFHMDIEYWEIWNEPECRNNDRSNPCWQGTDEDFMEFFTVAFRYLKERFPHLKIGGPSSMNMSKSPFLEKFAKTIREEKLALDFFSFHKYGKDPKEYLEKIRLAEAFLKEAGLSEKTELILNEWNYVRGWRGEEWAYSIRTEKGMKGAAFIAGTMLAAQKSALSMLMYYDARPCRMCGMFDTDFLTRLKGFYPFKMFNTLYRLEEEWESSSSDSEVYVSAAGKGEECAVMLCYYTDREDAEEKSLMLDLPSGSYTLYRLDESTDCEAVDTLSEKTCLVAKPNTVYLLKRGI